MNCVYLKQLSDQIKITSDYLNSLISQLNAGLQAGSHPAASTCPFLNKPAHVPGASPIHIPDIVAGTVPPAHILHAPVPAIPNHILTEPAFTPRGAAGIAYGTEQAFRNYQMDTLSRSDPPKNNQHLMRAQKLAARNQKRIEALRDHMNRNKNTTNKRRNIIKKYKEGLKNKLMNSTLNTESVPLPSVEALLASVNNEDSPLTAQAPKNPTTFFSDQDKLMDRRIKDYKKREEKQSQ